MQVIRAAIDLYSFSTVPIQMRFRDTGLGSATAFVWREGEQCYLVTNWHNVTGINPFTHNHLSKHASEPDNVLVCLNVENEGSQKVVVKYNLVDAENNPLWLVHPTWREQVDVIVLPIDTPPPVAPYPINEMSNVPLAVLVGMDVFILGYPFPVDLQSASRIGGVPVWKRGSIASEPQLAVESRYMLVDTASRPGMSGSPVLRREWGAAPMEGNSVNLYTGPVTRLVGVYSGRLKPANSVEAELGIVWPARLIAEIIKGNLYDSRESMVPR